ncbi:MAG TPA: TIGR03885 family FMN-dependent LLM class oxidoreductase [Polyangiaceae bacterium]
MIGFHASHEQFPGSELLKSAVFAQEKGVVHGMCSDHFTPFSERQGHSGYAWAWLGAALQATEMSFGTVCAPGQRYHPAIVAQAAATLAEMYPGRFWLALGSGENLNEHITGDAWPPKSERQQRLLECVEVMRALFCGETVTHRGLVRVSEAKLYVHPTRPPPLYGAAVSAETAAWVAGWADGLITVNQPEEKLRRVVEAFRSNGGEGKPMFLQAHVAYAASEDEALRTAHEHWRANAFSGSLLWDVVLPGELDAAARFVRPEDVLESVRVSPSMAEHRAWIERDLELGFERVYVHEVGPSQARSIEAFAELAKSLVAH